MPKLAAVALLALVAVPAWASLRITAVPALDDGGLVALIGLMGVVAGLIARRRK